MTRSRFLSILFHCAALTALMGTWNPLIRWNWHRIETVCKPDPARCDLVGSDTLDYTDSFRNFPRSIDEARHASFDVVFPETLKHPLNGPVSATLNVAASSILGLDFPSSMYFVLSLYASACALLLYHVLRTAGSTGWIALMLTGIATLSSAWVSTFSMPESYSLSVAALLLALWSGVALQHADARTRGRRLAWHLIVTGIASWAYLPISGAVCFVLGPIKSLRTWVVLAVSIGVVIAISVIPQLQAGGIRQIHEELGYGLAWGNLRNLGSGIIWITVVSALSVFSIIFPGRDFLTSSGNVDWAAVWTQPATLLGTVALLSTGVVLIREARRARLSHLAAPLLWLFALLLFHVFFNPDEVLLYLSVPLTLMVYLAGCLVAVDAFDRRTIVYALAVVLSVEVLNWAAFAWRLANASS